MYNIDLKQKAISLRRKGHTLNEISILLKIAQSTTSVWLRNTNIGTKARRRILQKQVDGRAKSVELRRERKLMLVKKIDDEVKKTINNIKVSNDLNLLLCSILFWTEGGKYTDTSVNFINSDPAMIQLFLYLLRSAFNIDESKLRMLVHLHEYHEKSEVLQFWSNKTGIPLSKFSKSYLKPHTKKRVRKGYMGTIRVRYYDYKVALKLRSTYNMYCRSVLEGVW